MAGDIATSSKHSGLIAEACGDMHVARKVVGIGSVGTRCWILFHIGHKSDDLLFLQLKEAEASVPSPFLPKSAYSPEGEKMVAGQRFIQGAPDIFLGWGKGEHKHFNVRQLRDMKGGAEFDPKKQKKKIYRNIVLYVPVHWRWHMQSQEMRPCNFLD